MVLFVCLFSTLYDFYLFIFPSFVHFYHIHQHLHLSVTLPLSSILRLIFPFSYRLIAIINTLLCSLPSLLSSPSLYHRHKHQRLSHFNPSFIFHHYHRYEHCHDSQRIRKLSIKTFSILSQHPHLPSTIPTHTPPIGIISIVTLQSSSSSFHCRRCILSFE